jgi:FkbM family methyltransferase
MYATRLILLVLALLSLLVNAQNDDTVPRDKPRKRRPKGAAALPARANALQVNYPLKHFESNARDWRTPAKYDSGLVERTKSNTDYFKYLHAQDSEDIWIYENYFYGMTHGVVMESGALDGDLFSNSFLFEKYLNWTTINVEADPMNYNNLRLNRQDAINVNGALCSEPRLLHYSSYSVIPVRGFIEFMSESFIKQWHGPIYNKKVAIEDLPTVQCVSAKVLMRTLNVKHIDLWILDVEGAEESVLKGTDFDEVRINMVAMECDEHDIAKNSRKTDILEANGFKCHLDKRNCMCLNNKFKKSEKAGAKSQLMKWNGRKYVKDLS